MYCKVLKAKPLTLQLSNKKKDPNYGWQEIIEEEKPNEIPNARICYKYALLGGTIYKIYFYDYIEQGDNEYGNN